MGSVSNTLCPPRDRNVPRRQYQWEADAKPMSAEAPGRDRTAGPVTAEAPQRPPSGLE